MFSGGGGVTGEGAGDGWGKYYRAAAQYASRPAQEGAPPREPGARRRKLAGYLQAANNLRQSYTQGYCDRSTDLSGDDWPQVSTASADGGELVLFPSYARMRPNDGRQHDQAREALEAHHEDWRLDAGNLREYDAVIEVDVRGWLFVPHSGPMNRKSRYALWVARQLCGLPAETASDTSVEGCNPTPEEADSARQTADAIDRSDGQGAGLDGSSSSGGRFGYWRTSTADSSQQPTMSPAEIKAAHAAFNARLAPFTYRSIPNTRITIFFYNDKTSQSRQMLTSDNGHFSIRAELGFIPTHVRVLVTERLSATEEIILHPPDGVSLISDIDDTIKHSAISLGTREVFKNTFTAPLPSLVIPGVAQWYRKLANSPYNVSIHYISNSPWQLYPLLKSFFQETGLPPGSFHLKQYSGMLQGIFEPAAERKKGTVERVIMDFPNRKWLLVGDSGEADLELYTDIAERWPDRIRAICIRDVTTTSPINEDGEPNFFDISHRQFASNNASSSSLLPSDRGSVSQQELSNVSSNPSAALPIRGPMPRTNLFRTESSASTLPNYPLSSSPASTTSSLSVNKPGPPPLPEKPEKLRRPPVPAKPVNLQQNFAPPTRTSTVSSTTSSLYDGHEYPAVTETPPAPPRRATTASSLKPPAAAQSRPSSPLPPGGSQQDTVEVAVSKKEDLWRRRWDAARERLEGLGTGIRLISWREGNGVENLTVRLVEKELGIKKGPGIGTWKGAP